MSNTAIAQRVPFSVSINKPNYQAMINRTIQDPDRARRFVSAIVSAVAVTPALQDCTPQTILSGALLGEALNLSPSPQLGQYYLVPFRDKKAGVTNAQFCLGYKGLVQLALRSGQYKRLNVLPIKAGELESWNPLTEEIKLKLIEDDTIREQTPTIGYYACFEYLNGFVKAIYWSKNKMIAHADRYSPAFSRDATDGKYPKVSFADYEAHNYPAKDERLYSSFWYKDFDGMAQKTMLRQLISKWGIMSVDLQQAFEMDDKIIVSETGEYLEPDDSTETEPEFEPIPDDDASMVAHTADNIAQVSLSDV